MSAQPTSTSGVVMVLRLNATGGVVEVEDHAGNPLQPVDVESQPIQGTVKSVKPILLMTTQVNPTCTWLYHEGVWYKVCT